MNKNTNYSSRRRITELPTLSRRSQETPANPSQRQHSLNTISSSRRRYQETPATPSQRPHHSVQLFRDSASDFPGDDDLERLLSECESPQPESQRFYRSGTLAGVLFFRAWQQARDSVVCLWRSRLFAGAHSLSPTPNFSAASPEELRDLRNRLREVFADHVRALIDGPDVATWTNRRDRLSGEISGVSDFLRSKRDVQSFFELSDKRKALCCERDLVEKRLFEFRSAMNCFLAFLEEKNLTDYCEDGFPVFKLFGEFNWGLIHSLILRECRRLRDGLPIYAYRHQILKQIHSHQITVLVGETGSGKSTQLVQFLADSGIAAGDAIVCTQPRKIAASSLAHRVREECKGCYGDRFTISYCPILSSLPDSKVIYTTDHALLQQYMSDNTMANISCIIVDEAHERSLNTDLLLALVRTLLCKRSDLRLIIMSATADANQLSEYFFGCGIFHVVGRNFPVDIRYVPNYATDFGSSAFIAPYVSDVVRMAAEIHRTEKEGAILAFLTSQNEVEWACDKFDAPGSVAIPLHGKLSFEEQFLVFKSYPGRRKVIFATNLAETSLTIPGVKYVIDSGLVKESKYEPKSGMNVLKVCRISQSSANQRAGRAGRTEPGKCYRLYSESDFEEMPFSPEPEIRRVHLGVAALRIFALGIKNVQEFDFVDAPSAEAIDAAVRNLVQLRAVRQKDGAFELTEEGWCMVKMGIEPRLGKLILGCTNHRLGREGIVLAAVMANASSVFFRVGTDLEKSKSDCLKVKFCHQNGDLFTLLSVYKEWEGVPKDGKSKWCLDNSINAKTMRRCHDTVVELETCLERELSTIIPTFWRWNPNKSTDFDRSLKKVILSSLVENVAMYSGNDQLGYEVALSGQHVQPHPSCSLLVYNQKPSWVVFSEVLSISHQYLVCVTSFDFDFLSTLYPPPLFDASLMETRKLQVNVLTGFGVTTLKKFCGKSCVKLLGAVSRIRQECADERINIKVDVEQNEIRLFARSQDMENVTRIVKDAVEGEQRWMRNECIEKCLYQGMGVPSVALFGAGAEIKHLELQKRCLTVDVHFLNASSMSPVEERDLLMFIENFTSGSICSFHKLTTSSSQETNDLEKLGRVTFLSPEAAQKAVELNQAEYNGSKIKVVPSHLGGDQKLSSFPSVRAKVQWPRRQSRGLAIVVCDPGDVEFMINDFSRLIVGDRVVRCEPSIRSSDSIMIIGIDKELTETELASVLRGVTKRRIINLFIVRKEAPENPSSSTCEEALFKEIAPFMPKVTNHTSCCRVQVYQSEPRDSYARAIISFDGRLHLEAAKALEQIDGKVLPGCQSWQKIVCQQIFHSTVTCSLPVYTVIRKQLENLLRSFKHNRKGVECDVERNYNGSYRVKITANATRTIAEVRREVEELMRGKTVDDKKITPTVLQHLFSRDGINLMHTLQRETGTHIFFERHSLTVRIFGSRIDEARQKLVDALLDLDESKQLEIHLRGKAVPPNLMKEVVSHFGADLHGLKEKVPGADFTLNVRRHVILMRGDRDLKPQVEKLIHEVAITVNGGENESLNNDVTCPICMCDFEDPYQLEGCCHRFCRFCLQEQCDSSIRNQDSFPLRCAHEDCGCPILMVDLRSLLSQEKLEELFRASLGSYVARSHGVLRFCPSPDCPAVYRVAEPESPAEAFVCGSCLAETCTRCHLENHPFCSCERYKEFKKDPDLSLIDWRREKMNVKDCPVCGHTIEKLEGCNHMECRCGSHICWICLDYFTISDDCYTHLRTVHSDHG